MAKRAKATPAKRDLISALEDGDAERDVAARRLHHARAALDRLLADNDGTTAADQEEIVAGRLRRAAAGAKVLGAIAQEYGAVREFVLRQTLRSDHRGCPLTSLVATDLFLLSSDKSGNIIKWRREGTHNSGSHNNVTKEGRMFKKQHVFRTDAAVLSLAVSPDGTTLLAGLQTGDIVAFDIASNRRLGVLGPNGHRDAVNSIAFSPAAALTAFSASSDRTVKVWSVEQRSIVDTLFGHQDAVYSVAAHSTAERCVSVGGRDRTARLYKLSEQTQLVFRLSESHGGSLDEVVWTGGAEGCFVSGSDAGVLSLWSIGRKKPVFSIDAHAGAITCLHTVHMSDLVISGSSDGLVKLWRVRDDSIVQVNKVCVAGFVTGIALLHEQKALVVAASPEGRLGRWDVDRSVKPSVLVFSFE